MAWCPSWADALGKTGAKRIIAAKNATTITTRQRILYSQPEAIFRNKN
jgi:hypothetical protein